MLLKDLVEYISVQETALNELSDLDPKGNDCAEWTPFRDHFWGKPLETFLVEEPVERDDKPIKAIPIDPPVKRSVINLENVSRSWNMKSRKILVRFEYKEAEEAAVSANKPNTHVFLVCGQPGIGKSVFLLILLMLRLAFKLPTVLQITASYAVLFHKGGVTQLTNLDNPDRYSPIRFPADKRFHRIWALIDLNQNNLEPAPIFRCGAPFFLVCTMSPRSKHTGWLNRLGEERFYMRPWSILEVVQARSFLGEETHSERQLWYLFHQFGASTRALALYGAHPDRYEEQLRRYFDEINPDDLPYIFRNPASSQNSHYLITIYPQEARRSSFERKFASRRVFDMVWENHLSHRVDLMKEFYNPLAAFLPTGTPAGWVFKRRMHQLLSVEQTLRSFRMLPHRAGVNLVFDGYAASKARNNSTDFQLTHSEEHHLVEQAEPQMDLYYRFRSSSFPMFDSLRLIHPPGEPSPILLVFWIIRNKREHDVKLRGLRNINQLNIPSDTRRYLVVVTPENIHPCITVPLEYFGGTVDVRSEETDRGEGEGKNKDQDEETDEDQDEEMDEDQDDATGGIQWALFRVFHCPVDMRRLFNP